MFRKGRPGYLRNRIILGVGAGVLCICILFGFGILYYQNRWYPNTSINGIEVSGLKMEQTRKKVLEHVDSYVLQIKGRDEAGMSIEGKDIAFQVDVEDELQKLYEKQKASSLLPSYKQKEYVVEYKVSYDQTALEDLIRNAVFVTGDASYEIQPPVSAYVSYSEEKGYGEIVPEVDGNQIKPKALLAVVEDALSVMETELDLSEQEVAQQVYKQPKFTSEDSALQEQYHTYNAYLLNWIEWDMGEAVTETLAPTDIKDWLSITKKGKVKIDKVALSEWIEKFCLKYKTQGMTREFTTHDNKTIEVEGGDYGWRIDYDGTVKKVLKIIKEERDERLLSSYIENPSETNREKLTTRLEPDYLNTAYQKDYANFAVDWDTKNYSEVDLSDQMVYVYRDGKLAYSTICVTGLASDPERATRTGCYYIKDKKEEYVLVGDDYETPTQYWVRIMWTGTGYHYLGRSDWSRWSPELYKTRGSHGCINLQLEDAKNIYNLVKLRDAVFIHE